MTIAARITLTFAAGTPAIWGAAVVGAVLIAIAILVYRRAARIVGPGKSAVLTALRSASLALLVLLLLGPIIAVSSPAPGRSRLALLVDASRSMLLPGDPAPAPAGAGARTRLAEAREAARVVHGAATQPVRGYAFHRRLQAVGGEPAPDSLLRVPWADGTAIGDALAGLTAVAPQTGIAGVVLVTDGVSTGGRDAIGAARELGLPILAVSTGASLQPPDVSVTSFATPDVAFADESTGVSVGLRVRGTTARPTEVVVRDGTHVLARARLTLPARGDAAAALALPPLSAGRHFLVAEAAAAPGEITRANNAWTTALDVRETKQGVLVVCGSPGFDLGFLARAIAADPSLDVTVLVNGPQGWRSTGPGARRLTSLPGSSAALAPFDAVVLADVTPATFGTAAQAAFSQYLAGGHGLLWLTGSSALGSGGLAAFTRGPLGPRVPLVLAAPASASAAPRVEPYAAPAAGSDPLVALDADPAASSAIWDALPPVAPGDPGLAVKSGARLLVGGRPEGQTGAGGAAFPIIAASEAGGRVVVWNGSGFWRWRLATAEDARLAGAYATLVQSTMGWLLAEEASRPLVVRPNAPVVRIGETLSFTATLSDGTAGPARITLSLRDAAGRARDVVLRPGPEAATYVGSFDGLTPGRYVYTARAVRGGRIIGTDTGHVMVDARSPEFDDVATDEDFLQSLARETDGEYLRATDPALARAVERLSRARREVIGTRVEVWSHPVTLAVVLLLLGGEWFLRKRWGLV